MFDTSESIALGQLIFFLVCTPPSFYILFKHLKSNLSGWLFLTVFCTIRIVGSAIVVHSQTTSEPVGKAGSIIPSVAVLPLIIAVTGVGHESYVLLFCG